MEPNPQPVTPSPAPDSVPPAMPPTPPMPTESPLPPPPPTPLPMPPTNQAPQPNMPNTSEIYPSSEPVPAANPGVYPAAAGPMPVQPIAQQPVAEDDEKDYVVAFFLSWLLGYWGADRFYVGKIGTGILKFITLGGLGIWYTVDLLLLAFGKFKDKQGNQLKGYEKNKSWVRIVSLLHLAVIVIIIPIYIAILVFSTYHGVQNQARDTERKTDINSLYSSVEAYHSKAGVYPTLEDMNSASFRQESLNSLPDEALKDPQSSGSAQLASQSSASLTDYTYEVMPSGCTNKNGNDCTSYVLTANLEAGGTYSKQSLN